MTDANLYDKQKHSPTTIGIQESHVLPTRSKTSGRTDPSLGVPGRRLIILPLMRPLILDGRELDLKGD